MKHQNKNYKTVDEDPLSVEEPMAIYQTAMHTVPYTHPITDSIVATVSTKTAVATANPNVPFHATQEEWWDYFYNIEQGEFHPVSEVNIRVSKWLSSQKK
jgi:hypothetical protein